MSEPLFDTHSTMGPREYRRLAGLPEPPEGGGTQLTFTVMCPAGTEEDTKSRMLADLRDLRGMGVTGTYRRERVRP